DPTAPPPDPPRHVSDSYGTGSVGTSSSASTVWCGTYAASCTRRGTTRPASSPSATSATDSPGSSRDCSTPIVPAATAPSDSSRASTTSAASDPSVHRAATTTQPTCAAAAVSPASTCASVPLVVRALSPEPASNRP